MTPNSSFLARLLSLLAFLLAWSMILGAVLFRSAALFTGGIVLMVLLVAGAVVAMVWDHVVQQRQRSSQQKPEQQG
jgi:membrane protein implicated in regulation of membrane protease activity